MHEKGERSRLSDATFEHGALPLQPIPKNTKKGGTDFVSPSGKREKSPGRKLTNGFASVEGHSMPPVVKADAEKRGGETGLRSVVEVKAF